MPTIADLVGHCLIDLDDGHPTHKVNDGTKHKLFGRAGLIKCERTNRGAAKVAQVRSPTKLMPQVGSQRPNVGARRTIDLDPVHEGIVGRSRLEAGHRHRAGLPFDFDTFACEFVEPFSLQREWQTPLEGFEECHR